MSEAVDLKRRRLYQAGQILVQQVLTELNALDVHGAHHSFRRQEDMEEVCIALALYGHKHRERDGIAYLLGSYVEGEQPSAPMLSAASMQKLETISMHFGLSVDTVLTMAIDHYYRHRVSFEEKEKTDAGTDAAA